MEPELRLRTRTITTEADEVCRALEHGGLPLTVEVCTALVSWAMTVCILTGIDVEDLIVRGKDCFARTEAGDGPCYTSNDGMELHDRVMAICDALSDAGVCPIQNVTAMYYFGVTGLKKNGLIAADIESMLRLAYDASARRIAMYTIEQGAGVN